MFLLLLSLSYLTNKKVSEVVIAFKIVISFKINGNEVDEIDVRLKIGAFATIRFCFTSAFFLQFFSYWFFRASFINQPNSSFFIKIVNS